MNDQKTTIEELKNMIEAFGEVRGWNNGENAKDLVMALSVEASELLEIFQWVHSDKADSIMENKEVLIHLKEEIADVFWYLIRVCTHFKLDLSDAVAEKAVKNAQKYPVQIKQERNDT